MPYSDPRIDLSPFEEAFGLPEIPVKVDRLEGKTLGTFHPPGCRCGDPEWGVTIDIAAHTREDPNHTLLHECMHALHYFFDREDAEASKDEEHIMGLFYGDDLAYENSRAEHIARFGAEYLERQGMRLWNG